MATCASVLSRVQLSATPWTAARQAPLSMGLPRQEHWTGCHFLLQGTFPPRRRNHVSCASCAGRWAPHHRAPWEAPTTGQPRKSLDVCAGIPKAVGLLDGDSLWKLKMNILRHPLPDTRPPTPSGIFILLSRSSSLFCRCTHSRAVSDSFGLYFSEGF